MTVSPPQRREWRRRVCVCVDVCVWTCCDWMFPPVTQTYFEDNPRDLQLLRHDKDLHPAVVKPHLKNVPEYLGNTHTHTHSLS